MEQPDVEFILAGLPFPDNVRLEIKKYLPRMPTPTARLIKGLDFHFSECPEELWVRGNGRTYMRRRIINARWAPPPSRPKILYKEGSCETGERTFKYDKVTGEPNGCESEGVYLTTFSAPYRTWKEWRLRNELEVEAREAREWTPVSAPVTGEAAFLRDVGEQEAVVLACLPDAEEQPAPQAQKRQRLRE
jgi:hypothetical protein